MKKLTYSIKMDQIDPSGNWNTAKNFFPTIDIDQKKKVVTITTFETSGHQKKCSVDLEALDVKTSKKGDQMLITGSVYATNWATKKLSGSQGFCFAVFVGDSGHIYTHRAPATKGWMNCDPEKIRTRLVKLGIGASVGVLQQGDFLLKPANGNSLAIEEFKHEWTSSSHHKFDQPVLSVWKTGVGRLIYIPEGCTVMLHHEAVDGIQHPSITIPAGQYIIGSTASQLKHSNLRD